jgi:hypothetical protein
MHDALKSKVGDWKAGRVGHSPHRFASQLFFSPGTAATAQVSQLLPCHRTALLTPANPNRAALENHLALGEVKVHRVIHLEIGGAWLRPRYSQEISAERAGQRRSRQVIMWQDVPNAQLCFLPVRVLQSELAG